MLSARVWLFSSALLLPFAIFRSIVLFRNGRVSLLRELTGYQVHHYHYGIILLAIGLLLLLLTRIITGATIISGFGLGTVFDGFLSSFFASSTRLQEISNYEMMALPTVVLLGGSIGIILLLYHYLRNTKQNPSPDSYSHIPEG